MEEQVQIKNQDGEVLDARLHLPEKKTTKCTILLHGFTGNKGLAWLHFIADKLEQQGIAALRLDLSGHGDSDGLFRDLGLKKGLADCECALEAMKERGYEQFALVGHSLGAAISLLAAARHQEVRCLVDVAGPTRMALKHNEQLIQNTYRQNGIEHGALLDDIRSIDLFDAIKELSIPILAIHGTSDDVVPLEDSVLLAERLEGATLERIQEGDHILIPFSNEVTKLASDWVMDHL